MQTPTLGSSPGTATTTVDADGYTAIRVNLPPIGFNKARISIHIDGTDTEIDLLDLEVPAVVVIDPGHGGTGRIDRSDGNHATSASGVEERAMTLVVAERLRVSLMEDAVDDGVLIKPILTRSRDVNLGIDARARKSGHSGADIFLSVHFNGWETDRTIRGSEAWIYPGSSPPNGYASNEYSLEHLTQQINFDADYRFAERILNASITAIHGSLDAAGTSNRGVKEWNLTKSHKPGEPTGTLHASIPAEIYYDEALRNRNISGIAEVNSTISRATLVELEFITNQTVDSWFNGVTGNANQRVLSNGLAGAVMADLKDNRNP